MVTMGKSRIAVISIAESPDVPLLAFLARFANVLMIRSMSKQTLAKLDREVGKRLNVPESFDARSLFPVAQYSEVDSKLINSAGTETLIRSFEAECLITCGAPILKRNIYSAAPLAVNVHWGIAPEFRGSDSIFWAIYHRRWDCIGLTLHQIDAGVDTGTHLATARPHIEPADTETSLWAKLALLAPELLQELLRHLPIQGGRRPDNTRGREYRYRDRTPALEAELASRSWDASPQPSEARLEFFFERKRNGAIP